MNTIHSNELINSLLKRIDELQKKNKDLSNNLFHEAGGENTFERILNLNNELKERDRKIEALEKKNIDLTSNSFAIARVIRMFTKSQENLFVEAPYSSFLNGKTVKLNKNSPLYEKTSKEGTIIYDELGKGLVGVRFPGENLPCRSGHPEVDGGFCDLLLKNDSYSKENPLRAIISLEGRLIETTVPEHLIGLVCPGDLVKTTSKSAKMIEIIPHHFVGNLAIVREVVGDFCIVSLNSSLVSVYKSKEVEKGDRVVLDEGRNLILKNIGKAQNKFAFTEEVNVTWEDIGGLEKAKKRMRDAIEGPHKRKALYKFFNKKPVKGILLLGPPGCGKTLLVKASARAIADIYKIEDPEAINSCFIYIKGPEMLTKWLGDPEEIIRDVFRRAAEHKKKYGFPAIIFFDEAEAPFSERGKGISSDFQNTLVPALLAEMDGLTESGALVIMATNRADIIDPAVVRDNRIDWKINIGRPDKNGSKEIFRIHFKEIPLSKGLGLKELIDFCVKELFSEKYKFYEFEEKGKKKIFALPQILNGAMIKGVVDRATSIAIERNELNNSMDNPEGLTKEDIVKAFVQLYEENTGLNHTEALNMFREEHKFEQPIITRSFKQ